MSWSRRFLGGTELVERQKFKSPNRRPNLINQALPDIEIKMGIDEREYETEVIISEIEMSPDQTRKNVDINNSDIVNLASNIEELGLLYPIIVRPHPNPDSRFKWQMIAGERRATAFRRLGREKIPAKVWAKLKKDDKKAWATTLSENTLREQLKPNEAANAIDDGRVKYGLSRDEIAATMGLTPEAVSRLHGTNKLPEELIVELDRHDKLKSRHIAAFRLLM
jgi:ParB/RepB/Spo0J family partition protein